MYILHFNPEEYFGDEMIFWGEFSNIPSYFVYHYLHQKSLLISDISKNHTEYLKWFSIQKLLYPMCQKFSKVYKKSDFEKNCICSKNIRSFIRLFTLHKGITLFQSIFDIPNDEFSSRKCNKLEN